MLSIIIPAKNEADTIEECLKSLSNQDLDRSEYEIIVVDGNSTDETIKIASPYADRIIPQKSKGIGGARRDGAEASRGDILVFTDADTIHESNWLKIISENLIGRGYDMTTGPVLFYDSTFRSNLLQLWRKIYTLFHLFGFYWLIGSNMAIKREAYQQIDGHRSISLLEDFDISMKMFKEGDILCKYDKRQKVYTSARRLSNLFTYLLIYTYGQYHYHITKDDDRLLGYPSFDKMDLKVMLDIMGMQKTNGLYSKVRSRMTRKK